MMQHWPAAGKQGKWGGATANVYQSCLRASDIALLRFALWEETAVAMEIYVGTRGCIIQIGRLYEFAMSWNSFTGRTSHLRLLYVLSSKNLKVRKGSSEESNYMPWFRL